MVASYFSGSSRIREKNLALLAQEMKEFKDSLAEVYAELRDFKVAKQPLWKDRNGLWSIDCLLCAE